MLRAVQSEVQMPEALQKPLELHDAAAGSLPVPILRLPVNNTRLCRNRQTGQLEVLVGSHPRAGSSPAGRTLELLRELMDMPLYP
jgi:hypothetical protein